MLMPYVTTRILKFGDCGFLAPSFFGEQLTFALLVLRVGRSSVTVAHEVSCDDEKRWSSTQLLDASDLDKHCSNPWPKDVHAALTALLPAEGAAD